MNITQKQIEMRGCICAILQNYNKGVDFRAYLVYNDIVNKTQTTKKWYKHLKGSVIMKNLGQIFESEEIMNRYFHGAYTKASKAEDESGIDGYLNGVPVQVKCGIHSDGGEDPLHGYSVVHKTSQKKLQNVKWLIYALPAVIQYVPRYKLNHSMAIIYKIDRVAAIKRKLFKYNKKGEIYLDKKSRLILDNMVKDGKADMVDIFTI